MNKVPVRFGVDIAKRVFAIHGVNEQERVVVKEELSRRAMLAFFVNQPPSIIGIEACSGSHYWARELKKQGHEVRLINSAFVVPYRRKEKNDANDAEAICEAIGRPGMRFVSSKSEDQQAVLMLHRVRSQSIATRTMLINQLHGHLLEFGFVMSKGKNRLVREVRELLSGDELPVLAKEVVESLLSALLIEDERIATYDQKIESWVKQNELAKRLMKLDGVGALTASAVIATAGDPRSFKHGREFAAWLGLVPKQHSSGGKVRLGGITKRGDRYLRTLLIHGARTVLLMSQRGRGKHHEWIESMRTRRQDNVVAVAYAAKQARMLWAVLMGKVEPVGV